MSSLLQSYLSSAAKTREDKIAVKTKERVLTYNELNRDANKFAQYLKSCGVARGDRVVVGFGNVIETVIAFWGALKADAIISVVNPEQPPEKLKYIMEDSEAKVLCTDNTDILGSLSACQYTVVTRNNDAGNNFNQIIKQAYNEKIEAKNIDIDLASIIYTSGSTGEPKGVMMTHRNMVVAATSINTYLNNQHDEVILCVLPLSFDYGLYQMIMAISCGATLILEKNFLLPLASLKKIAAEKVTAFPIVPSMLPLLYEFNKLKGYDLSSVRYVTNTGAALTEKHIALIRELFPNAKIYSMYGVTESKRCTYLPPEEINSKPLSVGKAIPNTEIYIVDDSGNKLASNQIGQLVVRGATVMKGYWNKPELSREKLKPGITPGEMVLYTGDYGYLDADGYFYFKGRMDEVLKIRGVKVSPKEIEDTVLGFEGIEEAAIVEGFTSSGESEMHLFVAAAERLKMTSEAIKNFLRSKVEKEKIPSVVHITKALPKTENGKINKLFLAETVKN